MELIGCVLAECGDAVFEAFEAFLEGVAGAAEIEADVFGVVEEGAVGEAEAVGFEVGDGVFEVEFGDVHPGEVGGFVLVEANLGNFAFDVAVDEVAIAFEVGEELVAPCPTVAVGGFAGDVSEVIDFSYDSAAGGLKFATVRFVGDDGEGAAESCEVVGLAGGDEGECALLGFG